LPSNNERLWISIMKVFWCVLVLFSAVENSFGAGVWEMLLLAARALQRIVVFKSDCACHG
jgi:hypothetical protein